MPDHTYTIRPMLTTDIPTMASIMATSIIGDGIFDAIWSHSQNEPNVYPRWRDWMLHCSKLEFYQTGAYSWVVCHQPTGEVVGGGTWVRKGESQTARAWQQHHGDWYSAVERVLVRWEHRAIELSGVYGREFDRRLSDLFDHSLEVAEGKQGEEIKERWHLSQIFVNLGHQRKGLASRLLNLGLANAEAEGVPATLYSTFQGRKLYEKHGFEVLEWPNAERVLHPNPEATPFMIRRPTISKS